MRTHKNTYSLEKMARLLKVSRGGFYKLRREGNDQTLDRYILESFRRNKGRYGSPRIHAELLRKGFSCSRSKVERRMKALGLYAGRRKHKVKTTFPVKEGAEDLLQRDFKAAGPNKKWCADLSYIPLGKKFIYLSVILDLYARKVVGWSLESHMKQELVMKTLEKAFKRRTFSGELIFHSDRGSQYRSTGVQKLLKKRGMKASQGLSAYDNAAMESFFGSLKTELFTEEKKITNIEEAKREVFEYIEVYYNRKRLHSTLDYMSPVEYEEKHEVLI